MDNGRFTRYIVRMAPDTTVPFQRAPQDLSGDKLLSAAPRDAQGRPCLGGISLMDKLGQGGMGAVYYGIHPRLGVPVAVKVLPSHLVEQDATLVQRFFREARIAAQVKNNHLVGVLDVDEENGVNYLVQEFVDGMSVRAYLRMVLDTGQAGLPENEALAVVAAATRGLAAAHAQGVIHRDVKPDNILIPYVRNTREPDLASAKLADLGLAKMEGSGLTMGTLSNMAMGTPGYMAPEQSLDARTAGPPADVFSMGATLYAILSGIAPFRASTAMAIIMKTINEPHPPLANFRGDVSPPVLALVDRCMEKDPLRRFPDAAALLDAIAAIPGSGMAAPQRVSPHAETIGITPTPFSAPVSAAAAPATLAHSPPPVGRSYSAVLVAPPVAPPPPVLQAEASLPPVSIAPVKPSFRWWIAALAAVGVVICVLLLVVLLRWSKSGPDASSAQKTAPQPADNSKAADPEPASALPWPSGPCPFEAAMDRVPDGAAAAILLPSTETSIKAYGLDQLEQKPGDRLNWLADLIRDCGGGTPDATALRSWGVDLAKPMGVVFDDFERSKSTGLFFGVANEPAFMDAARARMKKHELPGIGPRAARIRMSDEVKSNAVALYSTQPPALRERLDEIDAARQGTAYHLSWDAPHLRKALVWFGQGVPGPLTRRDPFARAKRYLAGDALLFIDIELLLARSRDRVRLLAPSGAAAASELEFLSPFTCAALSADLRGDNGAIYGFIGMAPDTGVRELFRKKFPPPAFLRRVPGRASAAAWVRLDSSVPMHRVLSSFGQQGLVMYNGLERGLMHSAASGVDLRKDLFGNLDGSVGMVLLGVRPGGGLDGVWFAGVQDEPAMESLLKRMCSAGGERKGMRHGVPIGDRQTFEFAALTPGSTVHFAVVDKNLVAATNRKLLEEVLAGRTGSFIDQIDSPEARRLFTADASLAAFIDVPRALREWSAAAGSASEREDIDRAARILSHVRSFALWAGPDENGIAIQARISGAESLVPAAVRKYKQEMAVFAKYKK
jgi:serine/threonine protein kinase